jgi:hypothetical protein
MPSDNTDLRTKTALVVLAEDAICYPKIGPRIATFIAIVSKIEQFHKKELEIF